MSAGLSGRRAAQVLGRAGGGGEGETGNILEARKPFRVWSAPSNSHRAQLRNRHVRPALQQAASACTCPASFLWDPGGEPRGRMRENEPTEGCGHKLASCHQGACQRAAGGLFFWVCSQPGGGVPGRGLALFGKSCVYLAGAAACGLCMKQLSHHWAVSPLALEEATGPTQERVWAGPAERRLVHPTESH